MGHTCIGIAALLLSLTGGMFLLAKTRKEALGLFYKLVAWFIIVLSFGLICCCTLHCMKARHERSQDQAGANERMYHGHFNHWRDRSGRGDFEGRRMQHRGEGRGWERGEGQERIGKRDSTAKH